MIIGKAALSVNKNAKYSSGTFQCHVKVSRGRLCSVRRRGRAAVSLERELSLWLCSVLVVI